MKSETELFEKLLLPIKETLKTLPTKDFISHLPTKGDLSSELNELFESVTIFVNEEIKKRDDKIENLEKKINELTEKQLEIENKITKIEKNEIQRSPTAKQTVDTNKPVESKQIHEKKEVDVCLIGDSIIRHVDLDRINPGKHNLKICKPGGTVENAHNDIKSAFHNNKIKRLIICTGTNLIPKQKPVFVLKELITLIEDVRFNMPDTQIFISSILPKHGTTYASGINYVNRKLNEASKFYNFDFIFNLQFQSEGKQNSTMFAQDQLHLSKRGVAQLAMNFKYRLKKLNNYISDL